MTAAMTSRRLLLTVLGLWALASGAGACGPRARPIEVVEASIEDIRAGVLEGRTTCRMVVTAYLDRIAAYDIATGLNAITEINPQALTAADSLDGALSDGAEPGPLHCAPILVKDNFHTRDLPTTAGSVALMGFVPSDDAFMVRRLRAAGAIVIAKTNMAEWAISPRQTVSSSYGRTANAYALDRTPAGSSGGTASAVAASFGVAGLGSDTGNSIRGPSSHQALVGIRSTLGLTSRAGLVPLAFDRDVAGPMARSVEDAVRLFGVVAGHDPTDPYTDLGHGRRELDYTVFLDADGLRGKRLGVLRDLMDLDADTAVLALFEESLDGLRRLGAEVLDPFVVPDLNALVAASPFCPRFRYDMHVYLEALGPAAPIRDVLDVIEAGAFGDDVEEALRTLADAPRDVHPAHHDPPCPDFPRHQGRQALLSAVVEAMDREEIDAFLFPTWGHPPAPLDRADEEYQGDYSQRVIPAAGLPAITVPMGFSYDRYPAGLQIAGRTFAEGLLFQLAYAYEQATLHRRPPDSFPTLRGR